MDAIQDHKGHSHSHSHSHRRSISDIPLGFSAMIQSSPQLMPISGQSIWNKFVPAENCLHGSVKVKQDLDRKVSDEVFCSNMNLDNVVTLVSSDSDIDNTYSFAFNSSSGRREGVKRSAEGTMKHSRSISMDSFLENFNMSNSPSDSKDEEKSAKFSLEFGNGEFSGADLKKIIADDKLAEIAVSDPKRAKRILANRQSAARSKERRTLYISELEYKVQALQTETASLSAQLTNLHKDSGELNSVNRELKLRLQAMQQRTQLSYAFHEALTAEVQRLKIAAEELRDKVAVPSSLGNPQQNSIISLQVFPMH